MFGRQIYFFCFHEKFNNSMQPVIKTHTHALQRPFPYIHPVYLNISYQRSYNIHLTALLL